MLKSLREITLEQCIDEWCDRAALREDDQCTQQHEHQDNGGKPEALSSSQEFP